MIYKGYEIDTTMYRFITVFYMGDDLVFHSIEEAKEFIDKIVKGENNNE